MTDKFRNKYRIKSHRMPGWDYSNNGYYFITVVTQNRECNLGKIVDGEMILSEFGKIIKSEWLKSFDMRDELFLDSYIIMPNHIHAIVVLDKNDNCLDDGTDETTDDVVDDVVGTRDGVANDDDVETHGRASLPPQPQLMRKPKSISSFLGGFKSAVNSKIDDYIDENNLNIPKYNKNNHFFQPNYHDHIIRNNKSYQTISQYIINNPLKWNDDKFNPDKKGNDD